MANISHSAKRPVIFLGVGILNTLLDFLFYSFLTLFILTHQDQIATAGVISGTFALLCAFLTHSLITWKGSKKNVRSVISFVAFTGFGMWVIRPVLLSFAIGFSPLYTWLTERFIAFGLIVNYDFVANTFAFGFMTAILLIYNYFIYNYVVFRSNKNINRTD